MTSRGKHLTDIYWLELGAVRERERIVALLEAEAQGIVEQFADYIEADFVYALIALIKGEEQ